MKLTTIANIFGDAMENVEMIHPILDMLKDQWIENLNRQISGLKNINEDVAVSSRKFPALKGVKVGKVVWDKKRRSQERVRKNLERLEEEKLLMSI